MPRPKKCRRICALPRHSSFGPLEGAADGTVESLLNLEVALRLREVFRFLGWEPVMTRESDVSIYSEGAATLREKKVSDIRNRVALVNSYAAAVLLSIHQNSISCKSKYFVAGSRSALLGQNADSRECRALIDPKLNAPFACLSDKICSICMFSVSAKFL